MRIATHFEENIAFNSEMCNNVVDKTEYQKAWYVLKKLPFDENTIFELIVPFLYNDCAPEDWWINDCIIYPWTFDSFHHDSEPIYEIGFHSTTDLLCFTKVSTKKFSDAITIYVNDYMTDDWFMDILESAKNSNSNINNLEIVHLSESVNFGSEVSFSIIRKYLPNIRLLKLVWSDRNNISYNVWGFEDDFIKVQIELKNKDKRAQRAPPAYEYKLPYEWSFLDLDIMILQLYILEPAESPLYWNGGEPTLERLVRTNMTKNDGVDTITHSNMRKMLMMTIRLYVPTIIV